MAKKFAVALKAYFGQLPGQTLREFSAELKELTEKDRLELIEMLRGEGIEVETK